MRKHALIVVVAFLVVLAGCSDSGGGGSDPADTDAANPAAGDGGDGGFGGGGGDGGFAGPGSMDSCPAGQSMSYMNPQGSSGQVSMEIEGIVTYENRDVCKAVWRTDSADATFSRMVMYFALDGSYQKLLYYDGEGNLVTEIDMSGGMGGMTDGMGGMTDGMGGMTDVSGSAWCPEGQQIQRTDPSTGQTTTMTIEGIVDHDGRQTCKAVWEVTGPNAERKEMYYTEDNSYLHIIGYDAEGNVVSEMKLPGQYTQTP